MSIKFHPSIELLLRYAAGDLCPAYRNTIAMHIKFCRGCEQLVNEFEALGGQTLELADNKAMQTSFEDLMARIDEPETIEAPEIIAEEGRNHDITDVDQILYFAQQQKSNKDWKKVTSKISDFKLAIDDPRYRSRLIHIKAGTKVPSHSHMGEEVTVVLKGSFKDAYGTYQPGDFIKRSGDEQHAPEALTDCICFAITDARLDYQGFFGPVINWLNDRFERKHYGSVQ